MALKHFIMELDVLKLKNRNGIYLSMFSLIFVGVVGCTHLFGVYPITKNVYLWDAGTPKERIIVFNSKDDVRNIVSGIPIIPCNAEYQRNAEVGNTEYVENYSFDGKWLLASTILLTDSASLTRYWIVNILNNTEYRIDEITKSTFGPLNYSEFDSIVVLNRIHAPEFSPPANRANQ